MQKMGPLYEAHPRFLAQDMVAVGSRDKFAYSNKRWFHYTDKGYWVEDEAGDIKSFAASAWTIVGRPSNAKKTRDLIYFLESSLYVSPLKFDAAVNLLGVGNGVVDLETGELLPPRPDMYLTKFTPVEYHPGAQCPNFYKHLGRLFQGQDADASIDWLQRAVGAALVHGEQFYVHLVGPEGSGKGTLYRALRAALGNPEQEKSNVVIIASENLDGRTQHPTWLMDLKGARLAIIEEIGKVSPALMNTLTGGDAITARRMRQDPVTFDPTHTLLCSSNERLQLKARQGARGLKRRYKPLDTGPTVPAEERSAQWEIAVQEEAEGILAWVIAGHGNWKARGLADLPGMTEAAEADVVEADWRELWWESQFERFLPATRENRVTTNEDIRINAKRWHQASGYAQWTDHMAEEAVAFVKNKGAKPWRNSRTRGYYVQLRAVKVEDLIRAA
jgi:putative DNA primase/helicase